MEKCPKCGKKTLQYYAWMVRCNSCGYTRTFQEREHGESYPRHEHYK